MRYEIGIIACLLLFSAMVLLSFCGERLARRRNHEPGAKGGKSDVAAGAVFALLGLLLAFSYSGAFNRLDERRNILVREANTIGTAYLRIDLLPTDAQPPLRELFRSYVRARIGYYDSKDEHEMTEQLKAAGRLQNDIWRRTVAVSDDPQRPSTRLLVMPALNDMIDVTTTHHAAVLTHNELLVMTTLFVVALVAAGLAGYSITGDCVRQRVHSIAFAFVVAFSIYMIFDIDYPRRGLVRLDHINQLLEQLEQSMH